MDELSLSEQVSKIQENEAKAAYKRLELSQNVINKVCITKFF